MDVMLYIDNLDKSTTEEKLRTLFMQVGEVIAIKINRDPLSGASKGFGFLTMSAQSEADKAVSMFNTYSLDDHRIKVALVKPRERRGFGMGN